MELEDLFLLSVNEELVLAFGEYTPPPPPLLPTATTAMGGGGLGKRYIWDLLTRADDDEVLLQ